MNKKKVETSTGPSISTGASGRPQWLRYGLALVFALIGWLGREALTPAVGPTAIPFIFFFPAIAAAAWYGGLGPAVLATIVSTLAADVSFIEPVGTLSLTHAADVAGMFAFLFASGVIIAAIESMQRVRVRLLLELSERSRLEREAAEARDLLATTLESIGDGVIVTNAKGDVTFLNPEAERLTGWKRADACGRRLEIVFRIINEETRRPADNPVETVLRTGALVALANHTVLLSRGGAEIPIDDSAAPVREGTGPVFGVVLVFRDVSEQRKTQRALSQLAAVVKDSGDAIFTKNLDGVIQTWNPSAEALFGYRADEAVGKPATLLIPPDRAEEESFILARLRNGQPVERMETVRVAKNGRLIPVSISVSPLKDRDGNVIGASKIIHDVTDIRAAREALERERELLATTLASIGDGVIVTDVSGRVSFMNAEASRLTGWTQSDAQGQELPTVFRIINERTRQPVENPVDKVVRLGTVVGLANHTILIAKDGTETPIDDSAAPIRQTGSTLFGVVLVFRDITERKHAEESVRESEERFRLMADAAPVLIWISGTDKLCTWFNKQWLEFVGRTMDQELGNGWAENVHPQDFDRCLQIYTTSFDAREPFSMEYRLKRRDGEYRWILDNGVPRYSKGEFSGYIGSCMDITDRRRAEASLREADRRKDEFLAILSHELRNPLAPIRLAVAMLRSVGPPQRELQDLRDVIERQANQLGRLLDDLLDVSRITSGKIVLRKDRVSLGVAVSSGIESSRPLIHALGHELVVRMPSQPIDVEADVARLAQVFANLLNNAAKYTEKAGCITLDVEREGSDAVVRIRDTGIGLSEDQMTRIFEMFTQVDQSLERRQGGLGVGLSLAKKLVELHGGRIEARSPGLGKGSEFIVRLPVLAVPQPPDRETCAPSDGDSETRRCRVLIADDNVDSATMLSAALRHGGHEVLTVHDGQAALDAAASFGANAAILDIGMPKMNGYDVARRLRAQLGDRIVLIAMTGWGQDEDKQLAIEAGFDHHLTKPVEFAAVEKALARSRKSVG